MLLHFQVQNLIAMCRGTVPDDHNLGAMFSLSQEKEEKREDNLVALKQLQSFFGNNRSCQDRLVISIDNPVYHFWKIFVVIACIASSLIYAYLAAFKTPSDGTNLYHISLFFELIFCLDMIVQFLLEFKPEDQYSKVRDLTQIAKRYIRGHFLVDLLALIPFN